MKLSGKLVRVDLGAGGWSLETDDGRRVELFGDIPERLSGRKVSVKGNAVESMGFMMTGGDAVEVQSIKPA